MVPRFSCRLSCPYFRRPSRDGVPDTTTVTHSFRRPSPLGVDVRSGVTSLVPRPGDTPLQGTPQYSAPTVRRIACSSTDILRDLSKGSSLLLIDVTFVPLTLPVTLLASPVYTPIITFCHPKCVYAFFLRTLVVSKRFTLPRM